LNLRQVAAALQHPGVAVEHLRFDRIVQDAKPGDFIYFDPPYAPVSKTARFTSYTAEGFDREDQETLRDTMIELSRRGCHVVMSNSTAPEITELYDRDKDVKAAGLNCYKVPARRAINSNAQRRGVVEEYVITNVTDDKSSVSPLPRPSSSPQ
jgi:DNA adenine methylase